MEQARPHRGHQPDGAHALNGRLATIGLLIALMAPASCGQTAPPRPPLRVVGIGFDDVVRTPSRLTDLAKRLRKADVNGVAVSAGRSDWTSFAWKDHPDRVSPDVRHGRDPFADAIRAVGEGQQVSAVVDVFSPRLLTAQPALAARDVHGKASDTQVSLTALSSGTAGDRLIEMIDYVSRNYPVTSVDLTETQYDTYGYGSDDKRSYRHATGRHDWPRRRDGTIDTADPSIGRWRSARMAAFVARAAATVHAHGKKLFVDVRVSWDTLSHNSAENGQDYRTLLAAGADRLVVWDYFAINSRPARESARLAEYLARLGGDKFILSVGMWAKRGAISAADLRIALTSSARSPLAGSWITPAGMIDDDHWTVLTDLWHGPL